MSLINKNRLYPDFLFDGVNGLLQCTGSLRCFILNRFDSLQQWRHIRYHRLQQKLLFTAVEVLISS